MKALREEAKGGHTVNGRVPARNDHTGKELRSKVPTDNYRKNWDKISWQK